MEKSKIQYRLPDEEPRCLACGQTMTRMGRSDRKFCSEHCKNTYHNLSRSHLKDAKRRMDDILGKNYSVLNSLIKLNVTQMSLQQLICMGFNPSYVTSFSKSKRVYVFTCYDIAYSISETRVFNIRRMSLTLCGNLSKL